MLFLCVLCNRCNLFLFLCCQELSKLKKDLESYRELMLPLNKVLEWEQNYYPAIVVGMLTFIFL